MNSQNINKNKSTICSSCNTREILFIIISLLAFLCVGPVIAQPVSDENSSYKSVVAPGIPYEVRLALIKK
jgi:hypothetical protein